MADALGAWHDFYLLLGGAAATLVGLTFVAASIAAGTVKKEHKTGINLFITPTLLHFTAILVTCLLIVAPFAEAGLRGASVLALGALGVAYSAAVAINMRRHGYVASINLRDRVWYATAPILAYLVVVSGAFLHTRNGGGSGDLLLAGGLGLLLLAGIRNAWDMVLWIVLQRG